MLEATLFPLAAVCYTAAILSQCRLDELRPWALKLFYLGVLLGTVATFYVRVYLVGGDFIPATVHGWARYAAWAIMALHALWARGAVKSQDIEQLRSFSHASHFAWGLWWVAFATGVPGDYSLVLLLLGGWVGYALLAAFLWFSDIIPIAG